MVTHQSVANGLLQPHGKWKVERLLSSLYYLFKDSPVRQEDFFKGVAQFKQISNLGNKSHETLVQASKDPLTGAKQLLNCVVGQLQPL